MTPQLTKAKRLKYCSQRAQKEAQIAQAIHDLTAGTVPSIWKATEAHDIPFSTLQKHLKGIQPHYEAHQHHQLLSQAQEQSLMTHLQAAASQGFPITYKELMDCATAFYRANTSNQDAKMSRKWARGFLYCNPSLLSCFSHVLDHSRAKMSNRTVVLSYFDLLQTTIMNNNISLSHIYNMDKTGFVFGQAQHQKVLVHKEKKLATYFRTQPGQQESATVIECIGQKIPPPLIIFKGKLHMQGWFCHQQFILENWVFAVLQNGWTNQDIGLEWLKHCFEPHTRPQNVNQKHLLLLDGHNSHTSLAFTEFVEKNGIILLCFPAHATHLLQPLDVTIFAPLKHEYSKTIINLAKSEITINKTQFLCIYIKIWDEIINPRNARSAFKAVGIDTRIDASLVLVHLPEDREDTLEAGEINFPQTLQNSCQLVTLASQIHSLEHPDRLSRGYLLRL